jgi:hypothetical protein
VIFHIDDLVRAMQTTQDGVGSIPHRFDRARAAIERAPVATADGSPK